MSKRFTLSATGQLHSPEKKRAYNRELFREVAPQYDRATRALSLFQEARWKKSLIAGLGKHFPDCQAPLQCLDLACGTGDLTWSISKTFPQASVTGVDLSPEMLERAQKRYSGKNVSWKCLDMNQLSFPEASLDLVTGGYALRNAPDLADLAKSLSRVLKPGGIASFLDFSRSGSPFGDTLKYWILKLWGGLWGALLHASPRVYGYIAESLLVYPDRKSLLELFLKNGFVFIEKKSYFLGITEITTFKKI